MRYLIMKRLIMALFIIAAASGLYAQNSFFPSKAGVELLYANNDAKGKPTGYSRLSTKDVSGSGANMTITYGAESLDKNLKPPKNSPGEMTLKAVIKDGVLILDLNQMIPANLIQQNTGINVTISGTPMELPTDLQPGQTLNDADVTVTVDLAIMKMNTVIKMTDGQCLAIEDVTVPAGTFRAYKITQNVSATIMRKTTTSKTVAWYAPNIGTIKTETYDAKNKLTSSSELIEVKGN